MKVRSLLLVSTWLFLHHPCFGQQFLLFRKNRYRQARYLPGDFLSFRIKNDHSKWTGRITGFSGDSLILFQGFKMPIRTIKELYVDEKTRVWYVFRYKYQTALPVAGVGFALLSLINESTLNKKSLTVSGVLLSGGLLAKILIKDRIKIKGKRKLAIGLQ